jgi:cytochrome c-type biogenesis protein CcmH/NrfF
METKTALLLFAPVLVLGLALAAWWWRARHQRSQAVALVPRDEPARALLAFEPSRCTRQTGRLRWWSSAGD